MSYLFLLKLECNDELLYILAQKKGMITDINQLDFNKKYTYADYLTWDFKERVELIKGKIFKMAPAPDEEHQKVSINLSSEIRFFLKKKKCQVRHAPYDVRLNIPTETPISKKRRKSAKIISEEEILTVVLPDILVICDASKIDSRGCHGAPDLVVEILSTGNNRVDIVEKFAIYQSAGVPEYWIIHPNEQTVTIYTLNEQNKYIGSKPFGSGETIHSSILKGLEIEAEDIFSS